MWGHPGDERLIELAQGAGEAGARQHVASCAVCRTQVEELRATLHGLQGVDVPEPSPLYWEAFRRQIARRIDEPTSASAAARWWWLPALAAALALFAFVVPRPWRGLAPSPPPSVAAVALPAWTPLPTIEDDEGLAVLQGLASTGAMASVGECQDLAECAAELGEHQGEDLARALGAGAGGGTS